jgi:radical SAM/Cys-rich protein
MSLFDERLRAAGLALTRGALRTLQVNLGRVCNQTCQHCHVEAGPWRTERMDAATAERVAAWIHTHRPAVADLTGGAPELNESFRLLVEAARASGARVIDRCNLTIIETAGFGWLPEYLAAHEVEVVASLPCYLGENVDAQRGDGVFAKSIRALRRLNAAGYGGRLPLDLVYNPLGPTLPGPQEELEADYREELRRRHGVEFTRLFVLTNQPVGRFAETLRREGRWDEYLGLLAGAFNPATVDGLMCRDTLSVDWQGRLYDCDFNQMLGWRLGDGTPLSLWDLGPAELEHRAIRTGVHCLACTAGAGSSCTGALSPSAGATPG